MSHNKQEKPPLIVKFVVVLGIAMGFVMSEFKEVIVDVRNQKRKIKSKIKKMRKH
tara:strand:- start:385 stop:549 length:165 start_codon:yes stop_codon:yes gene_type:complete